jgi:hypothetical protein
LIGRALTPDAGRGPVPRWALPAAAVGLVAIVVWCLPMPVPRHPPSASIALANISGGPTRTVRATIQLHPPDAAKNARWLTVTAWQGGGEVVDRLHKIGPGRYVTTKPIPASGPKWKVTLRLQRGRQVLGLPIYMPADAAIPAPEVPAPAHFTRTFERDKKLLQREQKKGVPGVLTLLAYLAVLVIGLAVVGLLGWGLNRLGTEIHRGQAPPRRRPPPPTRALREREFVRH